MSEVKSLKMKRRYKRYLYTEEKISRKTLWRRRQLAQQKVLKIQHRTDQTRANLTDNESQVFQTHPSVSGSPHQLTEFHLCTSDVSETDNESQVLQTHPSVSGSPHQLTEFHLCTSDVCDSEVLPLEATPVSEEYEKSRESRETLCPCTTATVGDVIFSCLALGLRHHLTWEAQIDIMKMITAIWDTEKIPRTKYSYFKYLESEQDNITYHVYCPTCGVYLGKKEANTYIQCNYCNSDVDASNVSNIFVSLSIKRQMQQLLKDPKIATTIINHRFERKKVQEDALEDIYDGTEYQKHTKPGGILSCPYNFSYSFFTDGIPAGKSSGKSMWPIYCTVNELPYEQRYKHVMLIGLYIGVKEPNQMIFLQPLVEDTNKLATEGLSWLYNSKKITSKIIPLCAVADSVARYKMLNMQSFHAYYGCTYCYQKQVRTTGGGRRFDMFAPDATKRSRASTLEDARQAYEKKECTDHHKGVKGLSVLIKLLYFNIISGFVIDYMHCILLGVTKTHMEFLFNSTRKNFWKGMNARVAVKDLMASIDERLLKIKPPSFITRTPRSIQENKLWKASEWRAWLVFYSIPCMDGLLKYRYLVHWSMLAKATCLLLQKSVSIADIGVAHELFLNYCKLFQKYFEPQNTIYNLHLLTHICECVTKWGPLWTHSAFYYEGENRFILCMYKSPYNALSQITRKFTLFKMIKQLCPQLVSSQTILHFCENILQKKLMNTRYNNCLLLGKGRKKVLREEEIQCLTEHCISIADCTVYERFLYRGIHYSNVTYSEGKRNNNSYLFTSNSRTIMIKRIVLEAGGNIVILGQLLKFHKSCVINNEVVEVNYLRKIKSLGKYVCIKPSDIESEGIVIPEGNYICKVPFGCHSD